jgi:hypothetical protein
VLGDAQLNATAMIPGSFVYTPAAGVALEAGKHRLTATFTPGESANYAEVQATVSLVVGRATPIITWPAPEHIAYGTPLSEAQLNATALIPGTFVYTPAAGTVLAAGTQRLAATFIPADSTDYAAAEASVPLVVEPLPNLASLISQAVEANPDAKAGVNPDAAEGGRRAELAEEQRMKLERYGLAGPREGKPEIRIYKGATYVKGIDGQWHLQEM